MSENYRDALERTIGKQDEEITRLKKQADDLRTFIRASKEYSLGYAEGEVAAIESMEEQMKLVTDMINNVSADVESFCKLLINLKKLFKDSPRTGGALDLPEGTRCIKISDTLAKEIVSKIEKVLLDHQAPLFKIVGELPSTESKEGDEENPKSETL